MTEKIKLRRRKTQPEPPENRVYRSTIDKAFALARDIQDNGSGRTNALAKKYGWSTSTTSRILLLLVKNDVLDKNLDGSFTMAEGWRRP